MALRDVLFENSSGNLERGTTPLLNERVTTSSPGDKQMLQYDGTNSVWALVDGANAVSLDGVDLLFGGLSDGDVICYDGTNWTNGTPGDGLQSSGGTLSVKAGDGIDVSSGDVAIDTSFFNDAALASYSNQPPDPGNVDPQNTSLQELGDAVNAALDALRNANLI